MSIKQGEDMPMFAKNKIGQNMFYTRLGENIKEARKRLRLNQQELGDKIGVSRISMTNIETGKQRLPLHVLRDVSKILGMSLDELVYEAKNDDTVQAFEAYPALSEHILRMALTGKIGTMSEWSAFLVELNTALTLKP